MKVPPDCTYRDDSSTVWIRIPSLLLDLQSTFGCNQFDKFGDFAIHLKFEKEGIHVSKGNQLCDDLCFRGINLSTLPSGKSSKYIGMDHIQDDPMAHSSRPLHLHLPLSLAYWPRQLHTVGQFDTRRPERKNEYVGISKKEGVRSPCRSVSFPFSPPILP